MHHLHEGAAAHAGSVIGACEETTAASALSPEVIPVPREIDYQVARLRLSAFGVSHDHLTPAQEQYLDNFVK